MTLLPQISPDFSQQPRTVPPAAQLPEMLPPETALPRGLRGAPKARHLRAGPHARTACARFPQGQGHHTELRAQVDVWKQRQNQPCKRPSPARGPPDLPARPPPQAPPTRLRWATPGWETPDPSEELPPGRGPPPTTARPAGLSAEWWRGTDVRQPGQAPRRVFSHKTDINVNPNEAKLGGRATCQPPLARTHTRRGTRGAGRTRPSLLPDALNYGQNAPFSRTLSLGAHGRRHAHVQSEVQGPEDTRHVSLEEMSFLSKTVPSNVNERASTRRDLRTQSRRHGLRVAAQTSKRRSAGTCRHPHSSGGRGLCQEHTCVGAARVPRAGRAVWVPRRPRGHSS